MVDLFQVSGIGMLIFALCFPFLFDKKGKTWFKGYGQCDFLNGCYLGHAKPRDEINSFSGEQSWYCDNHWQEHLAIGRMIDAVVNKRITNDQFWAWRKMTR